MAREIETTYLKTTSLLKAYYRFSPGFLTTDSSGSANTLTAIGTPVEGVGVFGGGVVCGTIDAYSATDGANFQPAGAFSVNSWIKTSATGSTRRLFQSQAQGSSKIAGFVCGINSTNVARTFIGDNTGVVNGVNYRLVLGTTNICDGIDHHLVYTYDTMYLRVYVDGLLDATSASWTNGAVYQATNYVRVACGNDTGTNVQFLNGSLDDVGFWVGTALTLSDVQSLYYGKIPTSMLTTGVGI